MAANIGWRTTKCGVPTPVKINLPIPLQVKFIEISVCEDEFSAQPAQREVGQTLVQI